MLLGDAITSLRAGLDDQGDVVAFSAAALNPGDTTVPVTDTTALRIGDYVLIGSGATAEGQRVIDVGTASVGIAPGIVAAQAAGSPIAFVNLTDTQYADAVVKAFSYYSTFRPLAKRMTLNVVAGTDTYALPADFIEPDRDSFDAAVGARSELTMTGNFYALQYTMASRFATTGWGSAQNFGLSPMYGYPPILGNPYDNPNSGVIPPGSLRFTFVRQAAPSLVVEPVPNRDQELTFWYKARHVAPGAATPTTVAEEDTWLALLYARYLLCDSLATGRAGIGKYKLENEEFDTTKAAAHFKAQAESALEQFNEAVRMLPVACMG